MGSFARPKNGDPEAGKKPLPELRPGAVAAPKVEVAGVVAHVERLGDRRGARQQPGEAQHDGAPRQQSENRAMGQPCERF